MHKWSTLLAVLLLLGCGSADKQQAALKKPLLLHVWLYWETDPKTMIRVIDSSHYPYRFTLTKESDGTRLMVFRFMPDPSQKAFAKMLQRVANFAGKRGYATTREDIFIEKQTN